MGRLLGGGGGGGGGGGAKGMLAPLSNYWGGRGAGPPLPTPMILRIIQTLKILPEICKYH